jgi:hypothetical protein
MWHDINQNTDEWLDLRAGKVTGSAIGKIMANYGKAFGEPAKKLAINIAVERVTGKRIDADHYMNAHMERGHQEEPIARQLYEEMFFVDVENGGFYDNGNTGCSLDGRVVVNGAVEIKSVIATTHYANIKRGTCDPTYKWQYFFNIQEARADWLDFVSYCSSFPEHNQLYVYRIHREDIVKELIMINNRLEEFENHVESIMRDIS